MLDPRLIDAIKTIHSRLERSGARWMFIGSVCTVLQGMDRTPKDIDIITDSEGIGIIRERLKDFIRQDVLKRPANEHFMECLSMKLEVNGFEVEVFGEKESDHYGRRLVEGAVVDAPLEGMVLPCLKIEEEAAVAGSTGREKKAALIREFLENRKDK